MTPISSFSSKKQSVWLYLLMFFLKSWIHIYTMSCFLSSYQGAKMSLCGAAECLCRDNDYGGVGEKEGSRGLLGRGGSSVYPLRLD